MFGAKELIVSQLGTSDFLFSKMTADLSDAEFFKPAIAGANHAGWIIGHVAVSEDSMVASLSGRGKRFADLADTFGGASTCHTDASKYPPRKKIEEMLREARANTLEVLRASDTSKWSDPSPENWPKNSFPTVGSIWALIGAHPYWHIGQLTVCRTAMSKKRVLG